MYHETKDRSYMTREFKAFLNKNLEEIYGKDHNIKPLKSSIDYISINDSDKPGIIESVTFTTTDGKEYGADYWHNCVYRSFNVM